MYTAVLVLHSLLRWLVLALLITRPIKALVDRSGGKEYGKAARGFSAATAGLFDLQATLGVVLFTALSPNTQLAFADMGAAMKDSTLRFWAVEHPTMMLLAAIAGHVGAALAKKQTDPARAHLFVAVGFGLALLLALAGIPWSFRGL